VLRGRRGFPCRFAGTTSRLHREILDSSVWEVGYRGFAPTHLENVVVTIHFWQKAAVRSKLAARVDLPTMMMLLKYIRQTQSGSSFKYDYDCTCRIPSDPFLIPFSRTRVSREASTLIESTNYARRLLH
jgi:hypothetical protein